MAGEAYGMARIVGTIVDRRIVGKAHTAKQSQTQEQRQRTGNKPFIERHRDGFCCSVHCAYTLRVLVHIVVERDAPGLAGRSPGS